MKHPEQHSRERYAVIRVDNWLYPWLKGPRWSAWRSFPNRHPFRHRYNWQKILLPGESTEQNVCGDGIGIESKDEVFLYLETLGIRSHEVAVLEEEPVWDVLWKTGKFVPCVGDVP